VDDIKSMSVHSTWHPTTKRIQSTRKYRLGAFGCKVRDWVHVNPWVHNNNQH